MPAVKTVFGLFAVTILCLGCGAGGDGATVQVNEEALMDPDSPDMKQTAPAEFRAKFETSAGDFVVDVKRELSPNGVDRFYNLVRTGYYNEQRFFRVLPGFVVQWGMHGNPEVTTKWHNATIPDDPVVGSNTPGTITFAKTNMPNSRTTQLFINLGDNGKNLDGQGFSAFGSITEGMEAVQAINAEYGQNPNQQRIGEKGNKYLNKLFPKLDYIKSAYILE